MATATPTNIGGAACLEQLATASSQLNKLLGNIQTLESKSRECENRYTRTVQALQECEAARSKPSTNIRNLPDGRLQYNGCYKESDTKRVLEPGLYAL